MVASTRPSLVRRLLAASRPLRFLIVGGLNTLAGYALYFGLVRAGVVYWLANFACLVFGVCLNFYLQGRYVFHDYDPRRFVRFFGFWFCIYLVQTACIKALMVGFGLGPTAAGLIVLPGATVASYFVQKLLVFTGARR